MDDLTVKGLIEILQKYDGDLPVIFGAKIADKFDDWLDFDSVKISLQYVYLSTTERKLKHFKTREVVNIELKD